MERGRVSRAAGTGAGAGLGLGLDASLQEGPGKPGTFLGRQPGGERLLGEPRSRGCPAAWQGEMRGCHGFGFFFFPSFPPLALEAGAGVGRC